MAQTPNKARQPPLAEISPHQGRLNAGRDDDTVDENDRLSLKTSQSQSTPPVGSPRAFWQRRDPLVASPLSSPNIPQATSMFDHEYSPTPSPSRRRSIERLKQASRVKNSSMFAREAKAEYDPASAPVALERPLAAGRPFRMNNPALGTSPVMTPTRARPGESPSPTRSSLAPMPRFGASTNTTTTTGTVVGSSADASPDRPRPLRRQPKSVTFDPEPPQVKEFEMCTPDRSSVAASDASVDSWTSMDDRTDDDDDGEYGEYGDYGDYEFEPEYDDYPSRYAPDDSFDASLEDTAKTPVVMPGDVGDDHHLDLQSSPVDESVGGVDIGSSPLRALVAEGDRIGSDGSVRPLPAVPADGPIDPDVAIPSRESSSQYDGSVYSLGFYDGQVAEESDDEAEGRLDGAAEQDGDLTPRGTPTPVARAQSEPVWAWPRREFSEGELELGTAGGVGLPELAGLGGDDFAAGFGELVGPEASADVLQDDAASSVVHKNVTKTVHVKHQEESILSVHPDEADSSVVRHHVPGFDEDRDLDSSDDQDESIVSRDVIVGSSDPEFQSDSEEPARPELEDVQDDDETPVERGDQYNRFSLQPSTPSKDISESDEADTPESVIHHQPATYDEWGDWSRDLEADEDDEIGDADDDLDEDVTEDGATETAKVPHSAATIRTPGGRLKTRPSLTGGDLNIAHRMERLSLGGAGSGLVAAEDDEAAQTALRLELDTGLGDGLGLEDDFSRLMSRKRGYLMRQNTKIVVASDRAGTGSTRSRAGGDKSDGRQTSGPWTTEAWNGTRRQSTRQPRPMATVLEAATPGSVVGPVSVPTMPSPVLEEEPEDAPERGRLFVKVIGLQEMDLPVPENDEAVPFRLTVDNGLHCVTTGWKQLGRTAQIGQEFELVVGGELEFQLTLQARLTRPPPAAAEPEVIPDERLDSPTKRSGLARLLGSPRKKKPTAPPSAFVTATKTASSGSAYDLLHRLVAEDGSFARAYVCLKTHEAACMGRPVSVSVPCFNEWALQDGATVESSVRSKRGGGIVRKPPYRVGRLLLGLMFVPKLTVLSGMSSQIAEGMPRSMGAAVREMERAHRLTARIETVRAEVERAERLAALAGSSTTANPNHGSGELSASATLSTDPDRPAGFLTQLGGDCPYWRRRYFDLVGSRLTGFHETTRQPRATINLAKAVALSDGRGRVRRRLSRRGRDSVGSNGPAGPGDDDEVLVLVEHAFRLRFGNGETIDFAAPSEADKTQWLSWLSAVIGKKSAPTTSTTSTPASLQVQSPAYVSAGAASGSNTPAALVAARTQVAQLQAALDAEPPFQAWVYHVLERDRARERSAAAAAAPIDASRDLARRQARFDEAPGLALQRAGASDRPAMVASALPNRDQPKQTQPMQALPPNPSRDLPVPPSSHPPRMSSAVGTPPTAPVGGYIAYSPRARPVSHLSAPQSAIPTTATPSAYSSVSSYSRTPTAVSTAPTTAASTIVGSTGSRMSTGHTFKPGMVPPLPQSHPSNSQMMSTAATLGSPAPFQPYQTHQQPLRSHHTSPVRTPATRPSIDIDTSSVFRTSQTLNQKPGPAGTGSPTKRPHSTFLLSLSPTTKARRERERISREKDVLKEKEKEKARARLGRNKVKSMLF